MINNCMINKTQKTVLKSSYGSIYYLKDYDYNLNWQIFEFFSEVVLLPVCSIIGIISCVLSLITLNNKKKEKNLTSDLFVYARINFVFNLIICVLTLLTMINNCLIRNGIYCPEYFTNIYMQQFDIYIFKYLLSVIKLACGLSEIFLALSRYDATLSQTRSALTVDLKKIKRSDSILFM